MTSAEVEWFATKVAPQRDNVLLRITIRRIVDRGNAALKARAETAERERDDALARVGE